jgi:hypothetical protein
MPAFDPVEVDRLKIELTIRGSLHRFASKHIVSCFACKPAVSEYVLTMAGS